MFAWRVVDDFSGAVALEHAKADTAFSIMHESKPLILTMTSVFLEDKFNSNSIHM